MTTMLDKIESLLAAFEHACILRDREAKEDAAVEMAHEVAPIVSLLKAWAEARVAYSTAFHQKGRARIADGMNLRREVESARALVAALRTTKEQP